MNIDLDQGWKELEWFKSMMEGVGILTQIKDERTWNIDLNQGCKEMEYWFKSRMAGIGIFIDLN